MSNNPPISFSHNHHQLAVKGCDAELDVLAFEGDEALSQPFCVSLQGQRGGHHRDAGHQPDVLADAKRLLQHHQGDRRRPVADGAQGLISSACSRGALRGPFGVFRRCKST